MSEGWFWITFLIIFFGVIGTVLVAVTVIGAARAWRNDEMVWVAIILGAWIVGMGWAAAVFYIVGVDGKEPRPPRSIPPPP